MTSAGCGVRRLKREPAAPSRGSRTPTSAISRPRPMTIRWSAVSSRLAHQMARDQNDPAFRGERAEEFPDPADAFRIEAVDRLVEEQNRRIPEQGGCDAEALGHPEREAAGAAAGARERPTSSSTSSTRPRGSPLLAASQRRCSRAGRPGWTADASSKRAHLAERPRQLGIAAAVHQGGSGVGSVEPKEDAQGRGLARAVRADEAGNDAGAHRERQVVHGNRGAVALP